MHTDKIIDLISEIQYYLSPYYLVRPRLWQKRLAEIDLRTMVSHEWKYVYVRIPKAANSTVVRVLNSVCPENYPVDASVDTLKNDCIHFSDLSIKELTRIKNYFVFSIVRNPYTRILSAYIDKIERGQFLHKYETCITRYGNGDISFENFCKWLSDGGECFDAHWMLQDRLLTVADKIDFVGKFEDLEANIHSILDVIKPKGYFDLKQREGPKATDAGSKLKKYFTDECYDLIRTTYRRDFERFNYDPNDIDLG